MNILFIGDIISKVGRSVIEFSLKDLKKEFSIDLTVANAENVAGFRGFDDKSYYELSEYGIDVFTGGNHIWSNKSIFSLLKTKQNIVVPANFPSVHSINNPLGRGFFITEINSQKIGIINLQGRVFMDEIDCPFRVGMDIIDSIDADVKIKVVDFHAEATSEKRAMGHYLNGKVSAVLGTHTHVQTADEEILSGGTAYISDVGMTGPRDSVIGIKKEIIIERFLTGVPQKFEVSKLDPIISFVVIDIDSNGSARSIKRFLREIDI